ncbi:MAG: beta-mannosidase [Patescibacteria group bacterium]
MQIQSLNGAWRLRRAGTEEWLPAQVPGDVHTALLAAGRIPDPFVADNEKAVQWVAEADWEYGLEFDVEPGLLAEDNITLSCDGLDTLAEVSLNGETLGRTANMFRAYAWDVNPRLRPGTNELLVRFASPVAHIRRRQEMKPLRGGGDIPGGPHLRKAPCQWGWDWGPKLPPIGIWKDIRLEAWSTARLGEIHLRQRHEGGEAIVTARVALERRGGGDLRAAMLIVSPGGRRWLAEAEVKEGAAAAQFAARITEPELWWPNGYGAQPLYGVEISLFDGERLLDRRTYRIGLRTVALVREPDQWGESFRFEVNNVPVFAKGADWIPADSFPTRITSEHLEHLVRSAAAAHMNMLRVWGGGFYEDERFYDLCDRYGILVWQDFAFACGVYPGDDAFLAEVRAEAVQNVRRLRHRASLALWCGNNEMEQGWVDWGWNDPDDAGNQALKAGYDRLFHHLLPAVCAAEDPDRPYWPSSASSGIPFAAPNSQARGDCHYWDVWHGRQPFTAYRRQFPRFMSEFGFQALPALPTVAAFAEPKDWNMTSYVMEHHQRSGAGNGLIIAQMTELYRLPKDFPALVYLSQVLQAEGIRYGVEHWRRHRDRVGGTLYWQLDDCWPVVSWSSIDYCGRWKALHYAARRFYAPLLLSVEGEGTAMRVHLTSDLDKPVHCLAAWRLETLDGEVMVRGEGAVEAAPYADTTVCALDFADQVTDENRRRVVFVCELVRDGKVETRAVTAFVPDKHLELADPRLTVNVREAADGGAAIEVSARSLARFVELSLAGADVIFSDNYFDLPAGRSAVVTCPLPAGWKVEDMAAALKARSLYDSY